jgi:uncharacterized protein (TIGR02145 family)
MMVDGKWTSSAHSSSTWSEPASYDTNESSGNTQNHGRSDAGGVTGGRGICPTNWHVPTDEEWGVILNAMETGTKNHNASYGWLGTDAGKRGKSSCTCESGQSGSSCVDDTKANWYYHANSGTDNYGFRVLPAGVRFHSGSYLYERGSSGMFWSSSVYSSERPWFRTFYCNNATVYRAIGTYRSTGASVRCIRDE